VNVARFVAKIKIRLKNYGLINLKETDLKLINLALKGLDSLKKNYASIS